MTDAAQKPLDMIPSFLGLPVGDLEDLLPRQVAIAGYFCDNLERPSQGQRYLARQLRYASVPGSSAGISSECASEIAIKNTPENAPANAIDLGDVNVFPLEPDKHFSAVISQCEAVLATNARMVLVGGDASGLKALGTAVKKIKGTDVSVVSITEGVTGGHPREDEAIILAVDLQELAAVWLSQPRRLAGMSPAQMIKQIENTPGNIVAAAVYGLAPTLDNRGSTETHAALAIVQAVTGRLSTERFNKGAL